MSYTLVAKLIHPMRHTFIKRIKIYFIARKALNKEFAQAYRTALDLYYESEALRIENVRLKNVVNDPQMYLDTLRENGDLGRILVKTQKERDTYKKMYEKVYAEWQSWLTRVEIKTDGTFTLKEE
jgi:ABC-type phosphonate transport system ATPase subunit